MHRRRNLEHKECEEQIKENISYQYGILLLCMYHVVRQGIVQHLALSSSSIILAASTQCSLYFLAAHAACLPFNPWLYASIKCHDPGVLDSSDSLLSGSCWSFWTVFFGGYIYSVQKHSINKGIHTLPICFLFFPGLRVFTSLCSVACTSFCTSFWPFCFKLLILFQMLFFFNGIF